MLLRKYPEWYVESPWIQFEDHHGRRWCQPDGLMVDLAYGAVLIVEIKYRHTSDAWYGLWQLYKPVLEFCLPSTIWHFGCLEICKWYDPNIPFPANVALTSTPARIPRCELTGVHIWNPAREPRD
jgi:hypothetical protein